MIGRRSGASLKIAMICFHNALLEKKPARLVSVAVANKTARIAWALLVRKEDYRVPVPVAA